MALVLHQLSVKNIRISMKTVIFHILRTFRFVLVNGAKLISVLLTFAAVTAPFTDHSPPTSTIIAWCLVTIKFAR